MKVGMGICNCNCSYWCCRTVVSGNRIPNSCAESALGLKQDLQKERMGKVLMCLFLFVFLLVHSTTEK